MCNECRGKGFIINEGKATRCLCSSLLINSNPGFYRMLERFNISSFDEGTSATITEYKKNFSRASNSLYISGVNSAGKTTLSVHILNEVSKKGFRVDFITFSELVRMCQELDHSPLSPYKTCDLLLIDDAFDKDKSWMSRNKWQLPLIDEFMRSRLELKGLPTIITSNKLTNHISENYSPHLQHLVERNCMKIHLDKELRLLDKQFDIFE